MVCTSFYPLAAGDQLPYQITLNVPAVGGTVTNCASVTAGGTSETSAEADLTNNRACVTHVVPPAASPMTGSLTIVKNTPTGEGQDFHFTTEGAGLSDFWLDVDGDSPLPSSMTFTNLAAGIPLTVTEDATSGWTLTTVTCTQSGATGASITFPAEGVSVNLVPGGNVTCTFTNVR